MAKRGRPKSAAKTDIKGMNDADRQMQAAARNVNAAEARGEDVSAADKLMGKDDARDNTKSAAASPEAAETPRQARDKAQKLFDKADDDGKAEIISNNQTRLAALGY